MPTTRVTMAWPAVPKPPPPPGQFWAAFPAVPPPGPSPTPPLVAATKFPPAPPSKPPGPPAPPALAKEVLLAPGLPGWPSRLIVPARVTSPEKRRVTGVLVAFRANFTVTPAGTLPVVKLEIPEAGGVTVRVQGAGLHDGAKAPAAPV